jgi:hypothetical protein
MLWQLHEFVPALDWDKQFLKVTFQSHTETKSPLIPQKIELIPFSKEVYYRGEDVHVSHVVVEYNYYGGLAATREYCPDEFVKLLPFLHNVPGRLKCHQWPWVFATFCAMGLTHNEIATIKLEHFLKEMEVFLKDEKHPLSEFKFKKALGKKAEWYLHKEEFEKWQNYVGAVIAY